MTVQDQKKLSKLLDSHKPIICSARLWEAIGRAPATFLQKLHYYLITEGYQGYFVDGKKWIYNTHEEWAEHLGVYSTKTIYRATKKLEKMGIISARKFRNSEGDHQKAYAINYDVLNSLFPWLTQEMPDMDISNSANNNQAKFKENIQIEKTQNVQIIHNDPKDCISSITSGEEVANSQVGNLAKPPRKEKISKPEKKTGVLTEANQTVYKLVEIYNKHIGEGREKVTLNKRLGQWLMAAYQKLGSCLKKWEAFCKRIATSDWLMGRVTNGFKASLAWLLKFEVMDRILGGDFKCKEPYEEAPIPTQEDEQEIIQEIEASETSPEEQSVKKTLLKTFGLARFKSYFAQAKIKLEEGKFTLLVENSFLKDQIDNPSMWGKIMALYPKALLGVEV